MRPKGYVESSKGCKKFQEGSNYSTGDTQIIRFIAWGYTGGTQMNKALVNVINVNLELSVFSFDFKWTLDEYFKSAVTALG